MASSIIAPVQVKSRGSFKAIVPCAESKSSPPECVSVVEPEENESVRKFVHRTIIYRSKGGEAPGRERRLLLVLGCERTAGAMSVSSWVYRKKGEPRKPWSRPQDRSLMSYRTSRRQRKTCTRQPIGPEEQRRSCRQHRTAAAGIAWRRTIARDNSGSHRLREVSWLRLITARKKDCWSVH